MLTCVRPRTARPCRFGIGIRPDHEVAAEPGSAALRPRDLAMTAPGGWPTADDLPLRRAIGLLEPLISG